MVTASLQVLDYRPAARCLRQVVQQPIHFGGIQVTRRRANPLIQPPASSCHLNPTNSPRVDGRIPPHVLAALAD